MNPRSIFLTFAILFIPLAILGLLIFFNRNGATLTDTQLSRSQHPQRFTIDETKKDPINVLVTTLPQFALQMVDKKFANLWKVNAAQRSELIEANASNVKGDTNLSLATAFDDAKKQLIVTPKTENSVKPGLYTLKIKVKTVAGKDVTITQDFTWGVLAINTNKGIYTAGETVKIGMGVLDNFGDTKCIAKGDITFETANVWLTITSPSGNISKFATDDGSIVGSKECGPKTVTNKADFQAVTTASEVGKYQMHMEGENINGIRSIDAFFIVQKLAPDFSIERSSYPTRIYPKADYPVMLTIQANKDYKGPVMDSVPENFEITRVSEGGNVKTQEDYKTIQWQVDFKKGQTYELSYTIIFPPVSPEFYLVGPLTIGKFSEGRSWQIASDAVWTLIQESHNTIAVTNASVTGTFSSTPQQGHLIIVNCYRTNGSGNGGFLGLTPGGNSMSATSTSGGFSTAENNSNSTSLGAVWMFYKIAGASEATAITCNKTEQNKANGAMGVQLLEFSGGSNTVTLDTAGGSHGNTDQTNGCNTNPFRSQTVSATPTNDNSLMVAAYYASAASRTVTNHIGSFIDTDISGGSNGFNNATAGTYDAGYFENTNHSAKTDTADFNAAGTACANVIATFNTAANLSQGGFRFYNDSNTITPGSPLAAANTNVVLLTRRFRLRQLLDNDSPSGTTLPVNGGQWKLQYALLPSGGSCASQTYSDVTTSSGIAFADDSAATVGDDITSSGNDPSDAGYTTRLENFYDNPNTGGSPPNITNNQLSIAANQAGLWDFSLIDTTPTNTNATYCFIIVNTSGAPLLVYNFYPQVTTIFYPMIIQGGTTLNGGATIQ